ncbi:glycosyltransferase [Caulobacter sp.]|uniref:glycosyltransferase n=1 Tax=Caulobacter sp. TaxID=78 RepID=UPI003BAC396E
MLTVVIPTQDSAHLIGACLASLVPAAVDGLVREVVLADGGSTDDTLAIAEDCGARVVTRRGDVGERLAAACVGPRGDWLLILRADAVLPEGWRAAVEKQLNSGWDRAAWLPRPGLSWFQRLPSPPSQGLLLSVRRYDAIGGFRAGEGDLARLARAVGAKRLVY